MLLVVSKYVGPLLGWLGGTAVLAVGFCILPRFVDRAVLKSPIDWTAHDAKVGTKVLLPKSDLFHDPVKPMAPTLLVFAGSCSQCSLKSVPPSMLQHSKMDQVILLYLSSEKQLKQTFAKADPKVRIIADPKGEIVGALGAESAPRFYLVKGAALTSIWKDTLSWPSEWTGEREK